MAVDIADTLRAELESGLTLPASWYSDPAVYAREQERIFRRSWQYACDIGQVAEPGQFATVQAGEVPLVVVRDKAGELRAFVNVCRHRGHLVAAGCGKRETLQCPYHAWTYDLDGSLRAAPRSEREPGFDRSQWGLSPALVDTWGPFVFVNPDLEAASLADTLEDLPSLMVERGVDPAKLEYRGRSREWIVEANWKIVVENYLECYHCPVAHPNFSRMIDVDPDQYLLSNGTWFSSQFGPVAVQRPNGRPLPYEPEGEVRASQFHFGWPNWTLNTLPGPPNVRMLVFEPMGPERTKTYLDSYWGPGTPDDLIEEMDAFSTEVGQEDTDLVASVHLGLKSGMIPQGRLLLDAEHLLQHFQLLVYDALA